MKEEFPLWRIWLKKSIPLNELRNEWTYPDILKANALLDMQEAYEMGLNQVSMEEVEHGC